MDVDEAPKIVVTPPGPRAKEIFEKDQELASPSLYTSKRFPLVWDEARGAIVKDVDGNVFIDFSSGIIVANVGHCHPKVVKAIREQAGKLIHCFDAVHSIRYKLFRKLIDITPGDFEKKVLLGNTGAEMVEAAVRLAKMYTRKNEIISFQGAFHGRTFLSLSLTGIKKYKVGSLGQPLGGVLFVPFPYCYRCPFGHEYPECGLLCAEYIERVVEMFSTGEVAALIAEPIQGAAGCVVPPPDFLPKVEKLCEEHEILFILDEIQTGMGRTGKMFASEHWGLEPDIILLGKGIASGVPTSALIAKENIMNAWEAGQQTSTFGNNPLSCAACLATIDALIDEKMPENAAKVGEHILKRLREMSEDHELIGDVRGKGLLLGVEFVKDRETKEPAVEEAKMVTRKVFEKGLIVVPSGWWGTTFRIAPPLVIKEELADKGVDILAEVLREVEK